MTPPHTLEYAFFMDWEFFWDIWEEFVFSLRVGLISSLFTYPLLQILFNKNYAANMLSNRFKIYKICADRRKKFYKLENTIKCIKIYLYIYKYIYVSFCATFIFRIFDTYFLPAKEKKFSVSFYPTIIFDIAKTLYSGFKKIIKYYNTGVYISTKSYKLYKV